MFDKLIAHTIQICKLEDSELKAYYLSFQLKVFKKKEFLLKPGEICNFIGFVNKGLTRQFYTNNNVEITVYFAEENKYTTEYTSFLSRKPSYFYIEALEETEVLMVNYDRMQELYSKSLNGERLGRLICEQVYLFLAERNLSLLIESPEERYLKLGRDFPHILQRVPQHQIASYLGIKPESLSRIRKRMSKKTNFFT
ncbi:Crp/Fnr family transcriptional regulator [Lacihabitans soyangensis]|uniref:Crp/Fnr family transcriptional regulator n=1 Tax=Lacihabitans soyangensis TaxID=869394 RepID=A0AAE3H743_9BACT|nr:Crp/Fnr family transcriptional regulator [Lacihabitans soyangensis]MCP9765642.1 Crp/Fnr family transcriptional regulator [Lacihabitans soyangensis]